MALVCTGLALERAHKRWFKGESAFERASREFNEALAELDDAIAAHQRGTMERLRERDVSYGVVGAEPFGSDVDDDCA